MRSLGFPLEGVRGKVVEQKVGAEISWVLQSFLGDDEGPARPQDGEVAAGNRPSSQRRLG